MSKTINEIKITEYISTKIPEDINKGEIYMATCKISNKSYIGQAKCFTIC